MHKRTSQQAFPVPDTGKDEGNAADAVPVKAGISVHHCLQILTEAINVL